jgi:hypothetical protein
MEAARAPVGKFRNPYTFLPPNWACIGAFIHIRTIRLRRWIIFIGDQNDKITVKLSNFSQKRTWIFYLQVNNAFGLEITQKRIFLKQMMGNS